MKILIYLTSLFFIISCSSTSEYKDHQCDYATQYWDNSSRYIVYQCERDQDIPNNCQYLRYNNDGSYQCIYRLNNRR